MKKGAIAVFSLFETLRFPVAGLALIFFLDGPPQPALAQTAKSNDPAQSRAWAPGRDRPRAEDARFQRCRPGVAADATHHSKV